MKSQIIFAVNAAIEASTAVLAIYGDDISNWDIINKNDNTPLTKADLASNQIIVKYLSLTKIAIISEELALPTKSEFEQLKRYWLVDPLDGTKEFINKTGEFTVNIALICSGRAVAGIICVPCQNKLYFAIEGDGAYCYEMADNKGVKDWEELVCKSVKLPLVQARDNFVIAKSVSFTDKKTDDYIKKLVDSCSDSEVVAIGSSLKFTKIAEGSVDCYPRLSKISQWDIAAGVALVVSSGGEMLDLNTNAPYLFDNWDMATKEFVCTRGKRG